ncbi:TPA: transposase, partial [Legionella pneumophila]|nr:transposase [Legionella pneumophila]
VLLNGECPRNWERAKLIQRRAYGFRNFENYRLRVKVLCS